MTANNIFDYSRAVAGLTSERNEVASQIDKLTVTRAQLSSSAYASALVDKIIALDIELAARTSTCSHIDAVLGEITALTAIDDNAKKLLSDFCKLSGCTRQEFMARMMFNYSDMISNPDIIALCSDTTTQEPILRSIAASILIKYIISPIYQHALHGIYRYIK